MIARAVIRSICICAICILITSAHVHCTFVDIYKNGNIFSNFCILQKLNSLIDPAFSVNGIELIRAFKSLVHILSMYKNKKYYLSLLMISAVSITSAIKSISYISMIARTIVRSISVCAICILIASTHVHCTFVDI